MFAQGKCTSPIATINRLTAATLLSFVMLGPQNKRKSSSLLDAALPQSLAEVKRGLSKQLLPSGAIRRYPVFPDQLDAEGVHQLHPYSSPYSSVLVDRGYAAHSQLERPLQRRAKRH